MAARYIRLCLFLRGNTGFGGETSPPTGNSTATVALPAFLSANGSALGTLGVTPALLTIFAAGF